MPLTPRTRLGPYEILATIGAGGMGEVYRAHDTRLGRDVALKILPADVAGDASRRARFEQEARAVAALNHPNIVAVYDVGDGYMVSELVDGETLRGAKFGVRKTLDIAAQIASGLAAAHAAGIVHRDLKPDNVLLTKDGRAKILDFGLARRRDSKDAAADETMAVRTEPGVVMGTAGYMSPEQVRGQEADHRSDIFSFGAMLHELLSGQRAFQRETSAQTMTAILQEDAPDLPRTVPGGVREVVSHCLEKHAGNRFQSARDLGFALHALSQGDSQSEAAIAPAVSAASASATPRRAGLWIAALVLFAIAATFALTRWLAHEPQPTRWSAVTLGGTSDHPHLSPDGQTLAFASADNQVGIMTPASGDFSILTHPSPNGYVQGLCWSSDGTRIFFDRYTDVPRGIFSVPKLGGKEQLLLEDAAAPEALPDGSLLIARYNQERKQQLFRFWPDTGRLQALPLLLQAANGGVAMRSFPDGKSAVAYGTAIGSAADTVPHLYRIQLESGELRRLNSGVPEGTDIAALAVTHDGKNILEAINSGSAGRVISVPAEGSSPARDVLLVTSLIESIDAGPDGSIYLDQQQRPLALVRFSATGGHAERIADFAPSQVGQDLAVLGDGRAVVSQLSGGHSRLMALEAGKPPEPLIYTQEETADPMAQAGPGAIVFLVGAEPRRTIGVGEVASGRITRRIPFDHGQITSLAATPDGKTIFCVADGVVWAIPASGEARKIRGGDRVATDPAGKYLLVEVIETPVSRFVRVPLDGSAEQEIPRPAGVDRPAFHITSNAIGKDGKILTPLGTSNWNWLAGILDPASGRYSKIPVDLDLDYHELAWTPEGRILAIGLGTQVQIWKFTPERK